MPIIELGWNDQKVNDLRKSKNKPVKPDEIQDGTYTVTNVGSFGSYGNTNHQSATSCDLGFGSY